MARKKKMLRRQPSSAIPERGSRNSALCPRQSRRPSRTSTSKDQTPYKGVTKKSVDHNQKASSTAYGRGFLRKKAGEENFSGGMCSSDEKDLGTTSSLQAGHRNQRICEYTEGSTKEGTSYQLEEAKHADVWSSEQHVALQNAYFQIRPSSSFWFQVSKRVPGKTAKDCFDRFYSAHPTPPATQLRSKKISIESPVRTITFASPMSSWKSKGRFGRGKQGLLRAHQTVRHILRQQKVADESYEADVFSAVEHSNPRDSLSRECRDRTVSPNLRSPFPSPATSCRYPKRSDAVCSSVSSKRQSLSWHFLGQQSSKPAGPSHLQSPEVLKAEGNESRLDRFLDVLHMRRMHKRKSSALQCQNNMISETLPVHGIAAAREAILLDAKEVLRASLHRKSTSTPDEEMSVSSDQTEEETSLVLES